jgi:CcmD family protein
MDNLGYLFAAYTAIWIVVFGYVFYLQRKQKRLQKQIEALIDSRRKHDTSDNKG